MIYIIIDLGLRGNKHAMKMMFSRLELQAATETIKAKTKTK